MIFWTRGSSPLTRGKLTYAALKPTGLRLIPAHAGKTARSYWITSSREAHPRSRGENVLTKHPDLVYAGSSPLTRGKRLCIKRDVYLPRLIPAHAGKTRRAHSSGVSVRAHPRSRGENLDSANPHFRTRGSSPLTRGKLVNRKL